MRRDEALRKPSLNWAHAVVALLRILAWSVRVLPPWSWHVMAALATLVFWPLAGKHRRRALANLAAQGLTPAEARRRGRASFRSNFVVLFESLAMPRLLARGRGIVVDEEMTPGCAEIFAKLETGEYRSAQAVSGHIGQWELAGAELARAVHPLPTFVSARLTKNPIFEGFLRDLRHGFGLTLVDKGQFVKQLVRAQRNGERGLYVFLCDQHFKRGTVTPFAGRPACTVPLPGVLVQKYRLPTLIGACVRLGPGHYKLYMDALDPTRYDGLSGSAVVRAVTRDINDKLTAYLERYPDQWTWGHRRWRQCCQEPLAS